MINNGKTEANTIQYIIKSQNLRHHFCTVQKQWSLSVVQYTQYRQITLQHQQVVIYQSWCNNNIHPANSHIYTQHLWIATPDEQKPQETFIFTTHSWSPQTFQALALDITTHNILVAVPQRQVGLWSCWLVRAISQEQSHLELRSLLSTNRKHMLTNTATSGGL